jgi:hypothetical protein
LSFPTIIGKESIDTLVVSCPAGASVTAATLLLWQVAAEFSLFKHSLGEMKNGYTS